MQAPRLCILSTGRAGSRYIAELLTQAGLPCGHERYYGVTDARMGGMLAESSYLALPRVEKGHFSGTCVHQVRDPLAVISSFMNGQMEKNVNVSRAHFQQMNKRDGRRKRPMSRDEWLLYTVRYVTDWNARCARLAKFTYRVEDVDAALIHHLGELAGLTLKPAVVAHALGEVSRTTNKHPQGPSYNWDDLPDDASTHALREHARRWGYSV